MKHTRPTITRILERIAELETDRAFWTSACMNAKTHEDAMNANNQLGHTLTAINELKALIGED